MIEMELDGRADFELHVRTSVNKMFKGIDAPTTKKLMTKIIMDSFDNGVKIGQGRKISVMVREHD